MEVHGLSRRGYVRKNNEDRYFVKRFSPSDCLLVVADGMGGTFGGDIAAQLICDTMAGWQPANTDLKEQLFDMVAVCQQQILECEEKHPELKGMGSTLTAALVMGDAVYWAQVGDSRLYLQHFDELAQITTDQNMAQELVEQGRMSPEEARFSPYRNVLFQCMGCKDWRPVVGKVQVEAGDVLLLCTDGLHGPVPAKNIAGILHTMTTVLNKAELLVQEALQAGGPDNVTVVVAEI